MSKKNVLSSFWFSDFFSVRKLKKGAGYFVVGVDVVLILFFTHQYSKSAFLQMTAIFELV